MDALEDALRVISSMNEAGVDYVVVGGVAMKGTVRPIDHADAAALRAAFDLDD